MNFKDKISKLCQYTEKSCGGRPAISVFNIEFEDKLTDSLIQSYNRDLKIKEVFEELEIDDDLCKVSGYNSDNMGEIDYPTLKSRMISYNIKSTPFTRYEDMYNILIESINNLTPVIVSNLHIHNGLSDIEIRNKILSKISKNSIFLPLINHCGSANSVIIGKKAQCYFTDGEILDNNISVIFDDKIDFDKIIVFRKNHDYPKSNGVVLINDIENKKYYFNMSNNGNRYFFSFRVI